MSDIKMIDFKQLSDWGLIYKINKEVLHPLGLALSRDPDTNKSDGAMLDNTDDLKWEYSKEMEDRNSEKLDFFLDNRVEILTKLNQ